MTYILRAGSTLLLSLLCLGTFAQSIADARQLAIGTTVTVSGTALNGSELGNLRYFQDAAAGIAAFPGGSSVDSFYTVQRGDSVVLTGVLSDFNGVLTLNPVLAFDILTQTTLPAEQLITIAEVGEGLESQLVRLESVDFQANGIFASGTYLLQDGNGATLQLYLPGSHPLIGNAIPSGTIDVRGILTEFNGTYQLTLRDEADLLSPTGVLLSQEPVHYAFYPDGFGIRFTTDVPAQGLLRIGSGDGTYEYFAAGMSSATEHDITFTDPVLQPATFYSVQAMAVIGSDTAFAAPQWVTTQSLSSGRMEVYFTKSVDASFSDGVTPTSTNGNALRDTILTYIARAQQTIDVAVYNNNQQVIRNALNDAVQRGVRVRYVFNGGEGNTANTALNGSTTFPKLGVNPDALMHHKFFVFDAESVDESHVLVSSANMTTNGLLSDYNNAVLIQDRALARAFVLEFEQMWGSDTAQPNIALSRTGDQKGILTPSRYLIDTTLVELYFSPIDAVTDRIVRAANEAEADALFGTFSFTKNEIGDALIDAHERGVDVRGIIENIDDNGAEYPWFITNGVPVRSHPPSPQLHHKYGVFDATAPESDPTVITGSHNWTNAAEFNNDEVTLVIHSRAVANMYLQEFEARWGELTTSLTTTEQAAHIGVAPNPVVDRMRLTLPEGTHTVTLYTAQGRLVRQWQSVQDGATLGVDALPAGLYWLAIEGVGAIKVVL